ncbi:MAG TPA: fibronectin type III domain-containing protein, partial [bacterium]|nr:fibronectin type III domain-containing protein [bacterium]
MKTLATVLLCLIAVPAAAVSVSMVATLPWGAGDGCAGYQTGADVVLGPAAMTVAPDGSLLLLDRVNRAVKRIDPMTGTVTVAVRLADSYFLDLACDHDGNYYLLHLDRGVLRYAPDGTLTGEQLLAPALRAAAGLAVSGTTVWATTPAGWRFPVYRDGMALPPAAQVAGAAEGLAAADGTARSTVVDGRARGLLRTHGVNGAVTAEVAVPFPDNLLTLVLLRVSDDGGACVSVEQADAAAANGVRRRLVWYTAAGSERASIDVPPVYFAASEREFCVQPDGTVYHLLLAPGGATVLRLNPAVGSRAADGRAADGYPETLTVPYHFNGHLLPEPAAPAAERSIVRPTTSASSVTRSEALVIAEAYRDFAWTAVAGNISADTVTVGDGHIIRTPDWVAPVGAAHTSVPYKWGGFSSLETFSSQQLAGKYTGSDYTSDVSWSDNYCVGVDCSGFVSRCWRLASKQGTSGLPTISTALASFDDMKTGDCVNYAGSHVRLFWKKEENGTYTMIEAMGTYWRVMTRNYTASALASYTPLRYNSMLEIEAPVLVSVTNTTGNDLTLRWQPPTDSTVQNLKLYLSTTGGSYACHDTVTASLGTTTVTGLAAGTTYWLNATFATASGREGLYSCDYIVRIDSGAANAPVLLVDDEKRYGAHGIMPYYGRALTAAGYTYDICSAAAVLGDTVPLAPYWAVIWNTGRGSSTGTPADTSLTGAERAQLQNYLLAGGNLLVSGQEVAYDLGYKGLDNAWLASYLKAAYAADDAGADVTLTGTSGKTLTGLSFELDEDNGLVNDGGAYDARWPDVIRALADTICTYSANNAGGVSYKGTYSGGTDTAAMVYLSFPFECIKTTTGRNSVMQKVMAFFDVAEIDTRPVITVALTQRADPGGTLTVALTATDNSDTASGLTWRVADTDPARWSSVTISEGAGGDTLTLVAQSGFGADTIALGVRDSDGNWDTVLVVVTVATLAKPGYPDLLRVLSEPPGNAVTLTWTEDAAAFYYVVYRTTDGSTFIAADTVWAPAAGVTLTGLAANTTYGFRIRTFNSVDTGSDSYSVMLPVRTGASANTLLLVEDDTTTAGLLRLWPFADGLNAAGRGFDSVRSALVTAGTVKLDDYGAVIWSCGNDSTNLGGSLTTEERLAVKTYLDNGGDLFLSGNDVARDLYTSDRDFLERYLKVLYGYSNSNRFTLIPDPSGMLAGMDTWYIAANCTIAGESQGIAPYMINGPDRSVMDGLTTMYGGRTTLKYSSGWVSGVNYTGGFGIEYDSGAAHETANNLSKLLFFMFDAACINDTSARRGVMRRVVTYFDSTAIAGRVDLEGQEGETG